jgi:hypothetical protein
MLTRGCFDDPVANQGTLCYHAGGFKVLKVLISFLNCKKKMVVSPCCRFRSVLGRLSHCMEQEHS